jgi:transmembrane 9 superfamily member 3
MLVSAFLVPVVVCGTEFFINFIAIYYHASRAIPFSSMVRSIPEPSYLLFTLISIIFNIGRHYLHLYLHNFAFDIGRHCVRPELVWPA